jgi:alkylation response protein AidB-like acyl-CoA dehydrogenase
VPILRAEITASLGMSEPGAGSDLAGLSTRAVLDGDHFVVNGQKVWTSGAHDADVLLAFVRTDPDVPKHKGLSALLIPTDTPGVTCRPFACVYDRNDLDFNEVFLTDVRVPAENLVGPLNGGWKVANGSLGHERTMMWLQFANRLGQTLESYRPASALHRDAYASIAMDYQALRLMGSAALARAARGDGDAAGLSVLKVFGSEAEQNAYRQVLEATGVDALADPAMSAPYNPYSPGQFTAGWFTRYIGSFAGTIAGGTSEIQRNIIAQHVLNLPAR